MRLNLLLLSLFTPWILLSQSLPFSTFQTNFEQKVTGEDSEIIYHGIIRGEAPDLLRWDYTDPIEKSIYVSGKRVIVVEPMLEQVVVTELDRSIDLYAILKQSTRMQEDFNLTIEHTNYRISPVLNGIPKSIAYTDTLGNGIQITTQSTKLDQPIPREMFQFTPPEHYDILRQ